MAATVDPLTQIPTSEIQSLIAIAILGRLESILAHSSIRPYTFCFLGVKSGLWLEGLYF